MHSSLGSVAVEQRREAASITRFTSESFTCNLVCLCVLPRTRSLQNYKLGTIESCSVEPPVFLAAPSFAISCFSFWPTPSPQYVS